ncbi:hypothetical protein C8R46DRAFT_517686 [Mycena filopes]|nr:hypothetical protein C8R46DRAFT_517686 [Mycena filopes]
MATQTNRTYSDFFASGLRAMSGTSYRPFSGSASPSSSKALNSSGRYNVLRSLARRSRTMSSPTTPSMSENTTTMTSTRHKRRSSIVNLPARLLERMMPSPDTCSQSGKSSRRSDDVVNTPRNSTSYEKIRPVIDPFDASPDSSSFFIDFDFVETLPSSVSINPPPTPPRAHSKHRQRPQSFLLLGDPAKGSSYLRLPLRRERPSSVQSMPPLPSQSRRSSLSFQYRPPSRDKYDRSWALEEEEDSDLAFSPGWSDDVAQVHDPAATIDWRQFHTDLLHEDQ